MIYKFKSKSAGDVVMMGPNGDEVLRLAGKSPAPQGIIEAAALPGAIAALEQAIAANEAAQRQADEKARADGEKPAARQGVSLRQRAWPLIEMMKRSHAEGNDVVWGV